MLGVPTAQPEVQAAIAAARDKAGGSEPPQKPEAALGPTTNRTMLGQPAPDVAAVGLHRTPRPTRTAPIHLPTPRPRAHRAGGRRSCIRAVRGAPRRRTPSPRSLGLAVRPVRPRVRSGSPCSRSGFLGSSRRARCSRTNCSRRRRSARRSLRPMRARTLTIEVPGAQEGTRVRFSGQEQALEGGRAAFALSSDDLSLGDNDLSVDVVDPEGHVETHAVSLHLEMRIRADLGPLANAPAGDRHHRRGRSRLDGDPRRRVGRARSSGASDSALSDRWRRRYSGRGGRPRRSLPRSASGRGHRAG